MPADIIDYRIVGDDMQGVIITLDPGEAVFAEAGGMMYMEDGIEMATTLDPNNQAGGLFGKLLGAGKRLLTGESFFNGTTRLLILLDVQDRRRLTRAAHQKGPVPLAKPSPTDPAPQKPARATGLARIFGAAGYSMNGAARLWREAAFRQEVIAAFAVLVLFAVTGAPLWAFVGFAILALMVLATEALNTALEEVVDHLSPDWSAFAEHAKDLGSFAVMCQLVGTGLFAGYVLLG